MNNVDALFMAFFGAIFGISVSAFYDAINVTLSVSIVHDAQTGFSIIAMSLCVAMVFTIVTSDV